MIKGTVVFKVQEDLMGVLVQSVLKVIKVIEVKKENKETKVLRVIQEILLK